MKQFIFIAGFASFIAGCLGLNNNTFYDVTNGDKILKCYINNEERVIDKSKIESYSDGVWYFNNGYSKSCKVE